MLTANEITCIHLFTHLKNGSTGYWLEVMPAAWGFMQNTSSYLVPESTFCASGSVTDFGLCWKAKPRGNMAWTALEWQGQMPLPQFLGEKFLHTVLTVFAHTKTELPMESILGNTVGFSSGTKVWDEHCHMHLTKEVTMRSSSQHIFWQLCFYMQIYMANFSRIWNKENNPKVGENSKLTKYGHFTNYSNRKQIPLFSVSEKKKITYCNILDFI